MRFPVFGLALFAFLAVSVNADRNTPGEYVALEKSEPTWKEQLQTYELVAENPTTGAEVFGGEMPPGLEPQKICIRLVCFPKKLRYQVCLCARRR